MTNVLATHLAEINEHLGPILAELGLKTHVELTPNSWNVGFVSKSSDWKYSPVFIVFERISNLRPSWTNTHLEVDVLGRRELGETGWESWKLYETSRREIRGKDAKRFEWLEFVLQYHGVVPRMIGSPNCIANPNFGDLYATVSYWFPEVDILQYYADGYSSPVEAFRFRDKNGEKVEICMRAYNDDLSIRVMSTPYAEFSQFDHAQLNEILRDMSGKYENLRSPVR